MASIAEIVLPIFKYVSLPWNNDFRQRLWLKSLSGIRDEHACSFVILQDHIGEPEKKKKAKKNKEKAPATSAAEVGEDGPLEVAASDSPDQEPPAQRPAPAPRPLVGKTVFVRGIATEVSKQQLQARLESFGPIKACRYAC